jgi:hypothetical protein
MVPRVRFRWRKKVTSEFMTHALRELRDDDMRAERRQPSAHDQHAI